MKDKLEVGMYVRTKDGKIAKFIKYDEKDKEELVTDYYEYSTIWIKDVIKASHNIIDLIEVGDYLNGFRVNKIERDKKNTIIKIGNSTFNVLENEEIYTPSNDNNNGYEKIEKLKSILTKEQFSNMEYRLGDDE